MCRWPELKAVAAYRGAAQGPVDLASAPHCKAFPARELIAGLGNDLHDQLIKHDRTG